MKTKMNNTTITKLLMIKKLVVEAGILCPEPIAKTHQKLITQNSIINNVFNIP
jgi:hypothetical protein